jgi:competence protein ComEA
MTPAACRALALVLLAGFAVVVLRARPPAAGPPPAPCPRPIGIAGAVVRPGVVCLEEGADPAAALARAGARCRPPEPVAAEAGDLLTVVPDGAACRVGRGRLPAAALRVLRVRIDPNRASEEELRALPGIGPALARRIVEDRAARGPFADVGELARVRGIGPRTVARLRDLLAAPGAGADEP